MDIIERINEALNENDGKLTYKGDDVFVDDKLVGSIKKVKNGFQYVPKGQPQGGTVFKSVKLVKQSLGK